MEKDISHYVHRHTLLVTVFIFAAFMLLAAGELYLYRKVTYVGRMVSEGLMQIKETDRTKGILMNTDGKVSFTLPKGTKIQMDGTVVKVDGSQLKVASGQMLVVE